MADTKISLLTDGVTANATDTIPAARAGANVYVTSAYIAEYIRTLTQTLTNKTLTTPTINGGTHDSATSLGVRSTGAAFDLKFASSEALTTGRTLTINVADGNRTLTIPATGTVGILSLGQTWTQPNTFSFTSIASVPAMPLTGTWFTGGTATTTKPHFLIEPTGTTSTAWSTAGTGLGVNAATGFTGNLLDLQVNGVSKFKVDNAGTLFGTQNGLGFSANQVYCSDMAVGNIFGMSSAGLTNMLFEFAVQNVVVMNAGAAFGWSSSGLGTANGATLRTNKDLLLTRVAAGVMKITNGSTGAGCLLLNPVAVASLPSAATAGSSALAMVNDATATTPRSTVAGGGANKVLVMSDGTNWLIV